MMGRQERVLAWALGGLIVLAVAVELFAPKPMDWTDTYEADDDRPYGSETVYAMLPHLFPSSQIEAVDVAPYQWLREQEGRSGLDRSAYVFITSTFHPDEAEAERLLDYAAQGGHLFIAARTIEGPLADSLGIETARASFAFEFYDNVRTDTTWRDTTEAPARIDTADTEPGATDAEARSELCEPPEADEGYTLILPRQLRQTGAPIHFVNAQLSQKRYCFEGGYAYLSSVDTLRTSQVSVAVSTRGRRERVTYARVEHGEGTVWVSTTPRMFTNYHALRPGTTPYVHTALSHLPSGLTAVWWDARHKPLVNRARTPLRFVLNEPGLRTGYYLILITTLLFIVVQGRRRQRPIPIMAPPENDTLEFVRVVGKLYHRQQDHADLARKKTAHFMAHVRRRYRVHLDAGAGAHEIRQVAERSGVPRSVVERAWAAVQQARAHDNLSADELGQINARIDAFYEQARA